jgi:DNA-binding GntR family transcriptional regulator
VTGPIVRPEPLREAVYTRIVARIADGELPPGIAVTEAAMAKELEVSRTPVREALLRLEADGVLRSTLARGFVVRPLEHREAAELYPILGTLEGLAISTAEKSRFKIGELRELVERIATETDPVRHWQLDTQFHENLVTAADNRGLSELVTKLHITLSRYELEYTRRVGSREQGDDQHRLVLDTIECGDLATAARLITEHWQTGMRTVLAWLEG